MGPCRNLLRFLQCSKHHFRTGLSGCKLRRMLVEEVSMPLPILLTESLQYYTCFPTVFLKKTNNFFSIANSFLSTITRSFCIFCNCQQHNPNNIISHLYNYFINILKLLAIYENKLLEKITSLL